ncbi:MAG: c-type cytochrome [Nitrospirales bacterium]|nr:c-type cytochrome [Nitrospirales bacterium]
MLVKSSLLALALCTLVAVSAYAEELDPTISRVPHDQRAAAQAMKNPVPKTPENIAKGKTIFEGNGSCHNCHGLNGKGDGQAAKFLNPSPRNFANPEFHKNRTDGEMYWVIKNGSKGPNGTGIPTGMLALIGTQITDEEAWYVILYERSFEGKK